MLAYAMSPCHFGLGALRSIVDDLPSAWKFHKTAFTSRIGHQALDAVL